MNTTTQLLKNYRVGTWCKRAAGIVLALGIAHIISILNYYYELSHTLIPGQPLPILTSVLSVLPSLVFYFFILYAAGTIVDYFVGDNEEDQSETSEGEEEDQEDSIEDDDLIPGQMNSVRDY